MRFPAARHALWSVWMLVRIARCLKNWREVWPRYTTGRPLPPLRVRRGVTLYHGPHDGPMFLVFEIFADGTYRRYTGGRLDGVLVDIGANIGATTLDWVSRLKQLEVHAYEPNAETCKTLTRNVRANGFAERVTVFQEAVGPTCGPFELWANMPSMAVTGYGDTPPTPGATAVTVPMVDLNEVVRRVGGRRVALLKIDAEGAEADILDGASPDTLRSVGRIFLEYHEDLVPGCLARCRRTLARAGFTCHHVKTASHRGMLYALRGGSGTLGTPRGSG